MIQWTREFLYFNEIGGCLNGIGWSQIFSGPGAFGGSMCLIVVFNWTRWFWVTQWTSCFGVKGGLLCG